MKNDRFLMGILAVIAALTAAALLLFFFRQDDQAYGAEDTPEGVVRNYILALQKWDYERAYTYLAEGQGKPDLFRFTTAFTSKELDVTASAVQIGKALIFTNRAEIPLTLLYASNDTVTSSSRSGNSASLLRQDNAWKLNAMPYPFFTYDWYNPLLEKTIPNTVE